MVRKLPFKWTDEQPAAIILVLLVLAFALLAPGNACGGSSHGSTSPPAASYGH